ncbi:MAG: hypothetical protein ACI9N9_000315 [Enterobacterales bacterium]|jgi:hypothetical protein
MSTLITYNMAMGMPSIAIHAPTANTTINGTDIQGYLVQIYGDAKAPFIVGVRFINCTVIAENLKAFDSCYFGIDCLMKIKNMPIVKGYESINNNCVLQGEANNKKAN